MTVVLSRLQHMNAAIHLLRSRMLDHPEWFRSDRICLVDTKFTHYWSTKYHEFLLLPPDEKGFGRVLPNLSSDYYYGFLPEPRPTNKTWSLDIDDLYVPLNVCGTHWVALHLSLPRRHITIYDSLPHHVRDAELGPLIEPYAVMMPYLLKLLATEDKKDEFLFDSFTYERPVGPTVPLQNNGCDCGVFTLKFIELHALGLEFPPALCGQNMPSIREKLATDLFHEISCRGPTEIEFGELD